MPYTSTTVVRSAQGSGTQMCSMCDLGSLPISSCDCLPHEAVRTLVSRSQRHYILGNVARPIRQRINSTINANTIPSAISTSPWRRRRTASNSCCRRANAAWRRTPLCCRTSAARFWYSRQRRTGLLTHRSHRCRASIGSTRRDCPIRSRRAPEREAYPRHQLTAPHRRGQEMRPRTAQRFVVCRLASFIVCSILITSPPRSSAIGSATRPRRSVW